MSGGETLSPTSPEELSDVLRERGEAAVLETGGAFSKQVMGGPLPQSAERLSTSGMGRLLAYEPSDLTISVEAGMSWQDLQRTLDDNGQFIPLAPPYAAQATVGGVVATDGSGPLRRRYGTARDFVIGMTFATAEGKLVQSGGMVVKNVTGLDMAKLQIGAFGTLAVIATVNFKVLPKPEQRMTFVFASADLAAIDKVRSQILESQTQPAALDLMSVAGKDYRLFAEALGNAASVERFRRDYAGYASQAGVELDVLDAEQASVTWAEMSEFTSGWMRSNPAGGVLRVSCAPANLTAAVETAGAPSLARAAAGVTYVGCRDAEEIRSRTSALRDAGFPALVEQAAPEAKEAVEQWQPPEGPLGIMKRLKNELDPNGMLNPGRLFGKI